MLFTLEERNLNSVVYEGSLNQKKPSKSTLQEQFRVHYGAPRDFRRYNLAVCLKMSQRLHEEHDMLLTFHTYAISLQNIITCSWKLAVLINQP